MVLLGSSGRAVVALNGHASRRLPWRCRLLLRGLRGRALRDADRRGASSAVALFEDERPQGHGRDHAQVLDEEGFRSLGVRGTDGLSHGLRKGRVHGARVRLAALADVRSHGLLHDRRAPSAGHPSLPRLPQVQRNLPRAVQQQRQEHVPSLQDPTRGNIEVRHELRRHTQRSGLRGPQPSLQPCAKWPRPRRQRRHGGLGRCRAGRRDAVRACGGRHREHGQGQRGEARGTDEDLALRLGDALLADLVEPIAELAVGGHQGVEVLRVEDLGALEHLLPVLQDVGAAEQALHDGHRRGRHGDAVPRHRGQARQRAAGGELPKRKAVGALAALADFRALVLGGGLAAEAAAAALAAHAGGQEGGVEVPEPEAVVQQHAVQHQVRQTKMILVENDRTELVDPGVQALDPEAASRDALELGGVHVGVLPKGVRASVPREVGEHQVHFQDQRRIVCQLLQRHLKAELPDLVEFDLLLAVADQEAPRRVRALVVDDVRGDQVVVVRALRRPRPGVGLEANVRARELTTWLRGDPRTVGPLPADPSLQVVQPLVEEVDVPKAFKVKSNLNYGTQGHERSQSS
mmetsp:Transcript_53248/g.152630  ORF Transcript_53248/g.152630 Transcript_53248/m.152630 type:complete len:576 (+) Transcript_53248:967-2694(+)